MKIGKKNYPPRRMNEEHNKKVGKIFKIMLVVLAIASLATGSPILMLYFYYALSKALDKILLVPYEYHETKWIMMKVVFRYSWPVFVFILLTNFMPDIVQEVLFYGVWDIVGV